MDIIRLVFWKSEVTKNSCVEGEFFKEGGGGNGMSFSGIIFNFEYFG